MKTSFKLDHSQLFLNEVYQLDAFMAKRVYGTMMLMIFFSDLYKIVLLLMFELKSHIIPGFPSPQRNLLFIREIFPYRKLKRHKFPHSKIANSTQSFEN